MWLSKYGPRHWWGDEKPILIVKLQQPCTLYSATYSTEYESQNWRHSKRNTHASLLFKWSQGGNSDTLEFVNTSVIHNQMIETLVNGLCYPQNQRWYSLAGKSWWITAVKVENRNIIVWLSGLFCAIIRANLLTFHFIPGKFDANNRVVWLSMVWLSGLYCI